MMEEMDVKLDKEKSDEAEIVGEPPVPPPDGEPPYDGPEHHSMGKPGDGIIYLSDIGEHVKLDKRGRPYRVGPDGRKEVRGSPRPKSSYSPEEWKSLSAKERDVIIRRGQLEAEAEKLKEIKLKKEEGKKAKAEAAEKKMSETKIHQKMKDERKRKRVIKIRRRVQAKMAAKTLLLAWERSEEIGYVYLRHPTTHEPRKLNHARDHGDRECLSATRDANDLIDFKKHNIVSPATPSETSTNIPSDDDGQEFINEWDEWSEHEVGKGPRAHCEDVHDDFNTGKIMTPAKAAPTASTSKDSDGKSKVDHFVSSIPCMPCVHQDLEHREKFGHGEMRFGKLYNAMVSRPVGRKEMMEDPDAKASMRNEWLGQHKQGVYDFSVVREYDDVVAEAKREGKEVHMARVHGICVEKNYQLPKGSPGRKFKGRGVLLGN